MKICEASEDDTSKALLMLLLGMSIVALLFTNQQATKLKGSPKAFDESNEISHVSLVVMLTSIFLVLVNLTTKDARTVQIITSIGGHAIFLIITSGFFVVKLLAIYNHEGVQGGKGGSRAGNPSFMESMNISSDKVLMSQREESLLRQVCNQEQLQAIDKVLKTEFK